jgi:hypothetical protein
MNRTANLRRQHDALLAMAADLQDDIERLATIADAQRIAGLLARLTGVLSMHLAAEDKALYPAMMASSDRRTADCARTFEDQMGGLAAAYMAFADAWRSPDRILAETDAFARDCETVFGALAIRIKRENEELYPLADAMAGSTRTAA